MRRVAALALLLLALPAVAAAAPLRALEGAPRALEGPVVHVVDGDTIHVRLDGRVEKVRYLGVDAPGVAPTHARDERRHGRAGRGHFAQGAAAGEAARLINVELVSGRRVRLTFEHQRHDQQKRLLAYVWVGDTMVNAEMVKRGYARVTSVPPDFQHRAALLELQDEARQAGRGLWQASPAIKGGTPGRPRARSAR